MEATEIQRGGPTAVATSTRHNSFLRQLSPIKNSRMNLLDEEFRNLGLKRQGISLYAMNTYDTAVSPDGTAALFSVKKKKVLSQLYINAEQLISFQLDINNEVVHSAGTGNTLVGAAAGGLLAGGAGAIVGAMAAGGSAGQKRSQTLRSVVIRVTLNSVQTPHLALPLLDEELVVNSTTKKAADAIIHQAQNWLSVLEILKTRQAVSPVPIEGKPMPETVLLPKPGGAKGSTSNKVWAVFGGLFLISAIGAILEEPVTPESTAFVGANALNVRSCPDSDCKVVGKLAKGEEIGVYEVKDGWSRVGRDERWVSSAYLTYAAPAANSGPSLRSQVEMVVDASPSDDVAIYRQAFIEADLKLISSGKCTLQEIQAYGMWSKSTTHAGEVYFTYCQDGPITNAQRRHYLDTADGRLFR